jgi:hypothetical protein
MAGAMTHLVDHMVNKCEPLNSILSTTKITEGSTTICAIISVGNPFFSLFSMFSQFVPYSSPVQHFAPRS